MGLPLAAPGRWNLRVRIESVEYGSPEVDEWAGRWFDGWFTVLDVGGTFGLTDPARRQATEERVRTGRRVASARRFALVLVLPADGADRVVAAASVELPLLDNTGVAFVDLAVLPDARRHGVGTALLTAVRDLAAAHGRTSLLAELVRPEAAAPETWPGCAFATARGFSFRLGSVRRNLALPADGDRLAALQVEADEHAAGYTVRTWSGPTPPEHRAELAGLEARMSTDAPLGDLDYEPEAWDADRIAEHDAEQVAIGRSWWTAVAVAPDGRWAAFTQLGWSPHEPERLYTWDTLVLREHRGRRLGLLVKLAVLAEATREVPQAKVVTTWNAAQNAPMIAVNEAMGFTSVDVDEEWQADLADVVLP